MVAMKFRREPGKQKKKSISITHSDNVKEFPYFRKKEKIIITSLSADK